MDNNLTKQITSDTVNYRIIFTRYRLWWIGLGTGAVLLRQLLDSFPWIIEKLYSRGIFLVVRTLIDNLLAWLPVPLIYLFIFGIILMVYRWGKKLYRSEAHLGIKIGHSLMSMLAFTGAGVFLFLFLWGFNYGRVPIEEQLAIDTQPLSPSELKKELETETKMIIRLRRMVDGADNEPFTEDYLPDRLERKLRKNVESWLADYGFPTVGRVRGRYLYPKGVFLRFSSSGLYFPFTGEGHIDPGLHPLQIPSVMAHELTHGYGFGDEGTCSFIAYLACSRSEDPFIAYAGHLDYWRTLAINYRRYEPDWYRKFRADLPEGIQADLDAINETLEAYPDLMPKLRYYAYDAYLKAQGIPEGMKNYSRIIMLVKAWRESTNM